MAKGHHVHIGIIVYQYVPFRNSPQKQKHGTMFNRTQAKKLILTFI